MPSSEHAHLDTSFSVAYEPKVSQFSNVVQIAKQAMKNIPGGTQKNEQYFNSGFEEDPHRIPMKKPTNQVMHLGW